MNPLALLTLPERLIALVVLAVALMGFGYVKGLQHEEAKFDAYKVAQQKAVDQQIAIGAQKTASLKTTADTLEKTKNDEIASINARLSVALAGLRNRPERRPDMPQTAAACVGATGSDLSGPDAEFLSREAARADQLRSALNQCQQQYSAAEQALR